MSDASITSRQRRELQEGANQRVFNDVPECRRQRMSAQRSSDTAPEVAIRRLLHARGLRYRVNRPLPGLPRRRADLTFSAVRVAVFVDGCFWHGCPTHGNIPRTNINYWAPKIARNVARDADTDHHLSSNGWTVVRIWEHESAEEAASRIERVVRARREASASRCQEIDSRSNC